MVRGWREGFAANKGSHRTLHTVLTGFRATCRADGRTGRRLRQRSPSSGSLASLSDMCVLAALAVHDDDGDAAGLGNLSGLAWPGLSCLQTRSAAQRSAARPMPMLPCHDKPPRTTTAFYAASNVFPSDLSVLPTTHHHTTRDQIQGHEVRAHIEPQCTLQRSILRLPASPRPSAICGGTTASCVTRLLQGYDDASPSPSPSIPPCHAQSIQLCTPHHHHAPPCRRKRDSRIQTGTRAATSYTQWHESSRPHPLPRPSLALYLSTRYPMRAVHTLNSGLPSAMDGK
ncbi:hypothetical protein DM02DRAFT_195076 [Periconia macrospinosa]|uniref:Uncharacterized protein n=1 Tax=Periconia macrospinosa TaxID=97972 RepID=A0A2V1D873_9PLEO|nr:hypothetical protein DM02DRAFT_195076 [Periconia macrospinosa]